MTENVTIRIQEADFDIAREIAALTKGRTDIGAVVSFSGICRGSEGGETIAALTLEHYPGMAEAEIARHADTAMSRWPLTGLTVIHRVGRLVPGENIVRVLTAPAHGPRALRRPGVGPNLEGQRHQAGAQARRGIEISQNWARQTQDPARFRPLC